jgi:hypothetical protein
MAFRCNRDMLGMRLQVASRLCQITYFSCSSQPFNLMPDLNGAALSQELDS